MKTAFFTLFILAFAIFSYGQDCSFTPVDGYTIFTSTDPLYTPPALTGFITPAPTLSGDWTVVGTTGSVTGNFTDDSGRASNIEVTGTGTITIQNDVTDVLTSAMSTCQQTYSVAPYVQNVATNPIIDVPCPLNLVLVIDESGSISDNMSAQIVRDAVMGLANSLANSGSQMAIVEFESLAERIAIGGTTELSEVNSSFLSGLQNYLDTQYDPVGDPINLIGSTNWEDALIKANSVANADLILLLTDGRPTTYLTSPDNMSGLAGEGLEFDLTALKEAADVANMIKSSNKHLFVAGIDFPAGVQPIRDISGPVEFLPGQGLEEFFQSDYAIISPNELTSLFSQIGSFCGPEIEVVPTLGEWGVINCFLLLMIVFVTALKEQLALKSAVEK